MSIKNTLKRHMRAGLYACVWCLLSGTVGNAQPASATAEESQFLLNATMTASASAPFGFPPTSAGVLPDLGQRQQLRAFVVHSLMHLHQDFGYISWAMSASRRNLSENLHLVHLNQAKIHLEQVIALAHVVQRWDGNSPSWTKVMDRLEEMKKAFELFQKGQGKGTGPTPDPAVDEAGKLFEKVGKDLPELFTAVLATPPGTP